MHLAEDGQRLQVALQRGFQARKRLPQSPVISRHLLCTNVTHDPQSSSGETVAGRVLRCVLEMRHGLLTHADLLKGAPLITPQASVAVQLPALLSVLRHNLPATRKLMAASESTSARSLMDRCECYHVDMR